MIDIVIVTYNRLEMLTALMENLKTQTVQDFHVIICDDGSRDIIPVDKYPIHKYTWSIDNGYHKIARLNEGISYCTSDKVILMDDDMLPINEHFIERHSLNLDEFDVSRGSVKFPDGNCWDGAWFCAGNMGFRTEALRRIGCCDPMYDGSHGGGDMDLGETVKKHGLTLSPFLHDTKCRHLGNGYIKDFADRANSQDPMSKNRIYFRKKWGFDMATKEKV